MNKLFQKRVLAEGRTDFAHQRGAFAFESFIQRGIGDAITIPEGKRIQPRKRDI